LRRGGKSGFGCGGETKFGSSLGPVQEGSEEMGTGDGGGACRCGVAVGFRRGENTGRGFEVALMGLCLGGSSSLCFARIKYDENAEDPGKNCGVCGDPIPQYIPCDNEIGGKFYKGIITGTYVAGQVFVPVSKYFVTEKCHNYT